MSFWARRRFLTNLIGTILVLLVWGALALVSFWIARSLGVDTLWNQHLLYAALLPAVVIVTQAFDRMPLAWAGIGLHRWTLRELGLGALFGIGMALVAVLPAALIGGIVWTGDVTLFLWCAYIPLSAAGEELLFRGYLFQRFVEVLGPSAATLLISLIFALMHITNPAFTAMSMLNIFLAGVFFSLGYIQTGSLWLPIGAHVMWNLALVMLGLPMSGIDFGAGLLDLSTNGPALLTGGAFGPEGSLITTCVLAAAIVLLLRAPAVTYSPYVHARTFRAIHDRQRSRLRTPESST